MSFPGRKTVPERPCSLHQPLLGDNGSTGRCRRLRRSIEIAEPTPVRRFKVVLEWDADDGVWVTYVPALNLLSTYGETREQALDSTHEAILGYLEAASKEGIPVPPPGAEAEVVELEVATS